MINYGLPGFIGPPQSQVRKQVWIRQPSLTRVISGPAGGDPYETYAINSGHVYAQNLVGGAVYEYLSDAWPFDFELGALFLPQADANTDGHFELAGEDRIANRLALVLDRINVDGKRIYRVCVDEIYGVLLCRREYGGGDFNTVLVDTIVNAIDFDVDFPPSIFDPFLYPGGHFARNSLGQPAGPVNSLANGAPLPAWMAQTGHERLSHLPAPAGFDPARSRLTFQSRLASDGQPGLDLFAGDYYLGRLPASSDSILACERSQDGRRIVYSLLPGRAGRGAASLFWADLSAVEQAHPVQPGDRLVGDFAISADGRLLAYFGCTAGTSECGVFVVDTASGRQDQLISLAFADYLLWKPDGSQIALLGSQRGLGDWTYDVIDIASQGILYQQLFDWKRLGALPDSPTQDWGVPFQAQYGGLQGCVDPPG